MYENSCFNKDQPSCLCFNVVCILLHQVALWYRRATKKSHPWVDRKFYLSLDFKGKSWNYFHHNFNVNIPFRMYIVLIFRQTCFVLSFVRYYLTLCFNTERLHGQQLKHNLYLFFQYPDNLLNLPIPFHYLRISIFCAFSYEMVVLLPNRLFALSEVLFHLFSAGNTNRFRAVLNPKYYKKHRVALSLPKFTINNGANELSALLEAMGLLSVFNPTKANFTKASKITKLHLSSVLHKAILEVRNFP